MRATIVTTDRHGADRVDLGTLGGIGQVRYSTSFPGGCLSASWQQYVDPSYQHRALSLGRLVQIWVGAALAWTGRIEAPGRGTPWQISAVGSATEGKRYAALPAGGNTLNLTDTITTAISRGLPWTVGGTLVTPPGNVLSATGMVDDALSAVASAGVMWLLTPARVLTTPARPTVPTLRIAAVAPPGARTLDGWATVLVGNYQDATSKTLASRTVTAPQALIDRYDRLEALEDLTSRGPLSASAVDLILTRLLATRLPRPGWTDPITCSRGQLTSMGGVRLDPLLVRAGVMALVDVTDPDTLLEPGSEPTLIIGQTDVDVDVETVQITPLAASPVRRVGQTAKMIGALSTATSLPHPSVSVPIAGPTNSIGEIIVPHTLGVTPSRTSIERVSPSSGPTIWNSEAVTGKTSTTVTLRLFALGGTAVVSTTVAGTLTVYP